MSTLYLTFPYPPPPPNLGILTRDRGAASSSLTGVTGPWARHIYPSLVLVQPRKTRRCLTERLLMGRNESNQTNKQIWESKPLVATENLGWAISLRKLNRDLEGFVNNWRPNPFHTFTRRLFCYYEEVLNCPALLSTKSNCHQQFNWNNLTHTRIPLQLFGQFIAEPVTFGSHRLSVHV